MFRFGFKGNRNRLPSANLLYKTSGTTDLVGESTKIIDQKATGTHEAIPGVGLHFGGTQYVELDSTVQAVGDFILKIKIRDHVLNTVARLISDDDPATNDSVIAFDQASARIIVKLGGTSASFYNVPLDYDGEYIFERDGGNVTITAGEISETLTATTATADFKIIGNGAGTGFEATLYDLYLEDSVGVKLDISLGTGVGTTAVSETGPNGTLNGFTLPDAWVSSALFGHSWNGSDGYLVADGTGTYAEGAILPASYADTESGTLYTGTARQNFSVKGYGANLAGTETLTVAHLTGAETVTESAGTSTVNVNAGGLSFGSGTLSYCLLSDGTELVFQSKKDADQITIYNVDGTERHGTFVGATVGVGGIWGTEIDYSYLALHGGQVSGVNIIPGPVGANTFNGPLDAPADVFLLNSVESPEIVSADDTNIFINASGTVLDVDPYDLPLNTSNKIYKGDRRLLMYNPALTEPDITKAERAVGDNPL